MVTKRDKQLSPAREKEKGGLREGEKTIGLGLRKERSRGKAVNSS